MWRKITVVLPVLIIAFGVLFTSILRTAAVKYEFNGTSKINNQNPSVLGESDVNIDYHLAYPGRVLPDSILWSIKALRDKVWLMLTTNSNRKAELKLLFADKRLGSSKILFERNKPEDGFSTLTKAEKYLEEASNAEVENRKKGSNTSELLERLAKASLKHYEVMQEIKTIAPEDATPKIVETENYAKRIYERSRDALMEIGKTPPENPFKW